MFHTVLYLLGYLIAIVHSATVCIEALDVVSNVRLKNSYYVLHMCYRELYSQVGFILKETVNPIIFILSGSV